MMLRNLLLAFPEVTVFDGYCSDAGLTGLYLSLQLPDLLQDDTHPFHNAVVN